MMNNYQYPIRSPNHPIKMTIQLLPLKIFKFGPKKFNLGATLEGSQRDSGFESQSNLNVSIIGLKEDETRFRRRKRKKVLPMKETCPLLLPKDFVTPSILAEGTTSQDVDSLWSSSLLNKGVFNDSKVSRCDRALIENMGPQASSKGVKIFLERAEAIMGYWKISLTELNKEKENYIATIDLDLDKLDALKRMENGELVTDEDSSSKEMKNKNVASMLN
ncbi:hypothetical protein Fmac_008690 [Flemingia macrophylla]|uniref:Uncharacterized protein n=1 Tax=Flemingia macrophylla TaxID=520843 RepID=A0ABD1MY51_9FABA